MAAPLLGERQPVRQRPVRDIQGLYLCYALNHPIVICVFWGFTAPYMLFLMHLQNNYDIFYSCKEVGDACGV